MGRMNEKVVHTERHWRCRLDTAQDKSAETAAAAATDTSYSTHAGSPSFDDNAAATAIAVFLFRPLSPVSVCLFLLLLRWEWAATADRRRRSDDTIADRPAANRQLKKKKKKTQLWQKQQSKKGIERQQQQFRRAQLATTVC